jgi:valyl-tRNA synthetase
MGTVNNLPTVYDPAQVERKWYEYWKNLGCFTPQPDEKQKMFSIVMPPPNVTGALHLGHALDNTIQAKIRYTNTTAAGPQFGGRP